MYIEQPSSFAAYVDLSNTACIMLMHVYVSCNYDTCKLITNGSVDFILCMCPAMHAG